MPKPIQGFKSPWQKLEWSRKTHPLCAIEFVTNCNWEGQLRTVANIYCKTSSPPNFSIDSKSTDVAKGNDFHRVVVTVKSQKSAKYIFRVIFSWRARVIYIQINSIGSWRGETTKWPCTKTPTLYTTFHIMEIFNEIIWWNHFIISKRSNTIGD